MLKTSPSRGAKLAAIQDFCARSPGNMSLEFPMEKMASAAMTK